jgi:hypothetical protein
MKHLLTGDPDHDRWVRAEERAAALEWWQQHGQRLRNAIAEHIAKDATSDDALEEAPRLAAERIAALEVERDDARAKADWTGPWQQGAYTYQEAIDKITNLQVQVAAMEAELLAAGEALSDSSGLLHSLRDGIANECGAIDDQVEINNAVIALPHFARLLAAKE